MGETDNKGRNVFIPKKKQNVFVPEGRPQEPAEKRVRTLEQPALDAEEPPKQGTILLEEEPVPAAEPPKQGTILLEEEPAPAAETPKQGTILLEEEPVPAAEAPKQGTILLDEEPVPAAGAPKQGTILLEEEPAPAAGAPKQGTILLDEEAQGANGIIFLDEDAPAGAPKIAASSQVINGFSGQPQAQKAAFDDTERKADAAFLKSRGFFRCLSCMQEYDTEHFKACPYCGFVQGTGPREEYHLYPGAILSGRYVIGTVLGFGGFGITYKAWDLQLQTVIAIKEYYPVGQVNRIPGTKKVIRYSGKTGNAYDKGLERFLEEARNTAKFNQHPNIVHVFNFFEENGTAYMTMELLVGEDLLQYMKRHGGKISVPEAVSMFSYIADALKEIHSKGMIHRDLSPDNFFICQDSTVKLIDLGAARFSSDYDEKEKTIMLKVGMAPPEQYFKKGHQGPWTDVYALSASLYWALTGVEPEESTDRQKEDLLKPPSMLNPEIPEQISKVIMKGMDLLPELRFQSMDDFRRALRGEKTVVENKTLVKRRRRRRTMLIAGGLAIALAGVAAGAGMYMMKRDEEYLSASTVSIWIPVPEDADEKEQEKRWNEVLQTFREDYPAVTVKLELIPEEDYTDDLADALEKGNAPALFMSTGLGAESEEYFADLEQTLERIDRGDYYYLSEYERIYPERKRLPMGFHENVVYGNVILAQDGKELPEKNDKEAFLAKESLLCVADTRDFYEMQENLRAVYTILPQEDPAKCGVAFDTEWSVYEEADRKEKNAAKRILTYMMSPAGQQLLHIEGQRSMPLSKEQLEQYLAVYPQLSVLLEEPEKLQVYTEQQLETMSEELFRELVTTEEIRDTISATEAS
ncbi:MAG: protein kinase [Clostridium sp.]|nr:protein kinase [Clostridium sp.]